MKNKQKLWRRMSVKRYDGSTEIRTGRQLRDMISKSFANQQGILTSPLLKIFKLAGIATPVYDAQMTAMHKSAIQNDIIEDSVILNEGSIASATA